MDKSVAQQQRERSKQSVSRDDILNRRVRRCIGPGCYKWDETWHENENETYAFVVKPIRCDECDEMIDEGQIVSLGERYVEVDCPIPIRGLDKVHLTCCDWIHHEVKDGLRTQDDLLNEFYQRKGEKMTQWDGWEALPEDEKRRLLTICGIDIQPHHLQSAMPFEGCSFVITGSFTGSGEDHQKAIESLGGKVVGNIGKRTQVTHILLGASGTTMYGQPTGKGSKKFKEAMKKRPKPQVVEGLDFYNAIEKWRKEREWPAFSLMPAPASASSDMPAEASATTTTVTTSDAGEPLLPVTSAGAGDAEAATSAPTSAPEPAPASTPAEKATETEACRDDAELDASRLESLSRRELQSLAKKHRIKANKASCEIIRDLKRLRRAPEDEED